jgi:hypothetical protein
VGLDLGLVSAVAGIAGSGISALGAISTGEANAASANYQAQVAANNQITANQNAAYAIKAGEQQATNEAFKARAEEQHLKAEIAANGIDVNSGSAVDLRTSAAEKGQLDTETTRQAAALTAYGYRTESTNDAAQAQLLKAQAGFDTTAGFASAGGSLLAGASNIGLKWSGLGTTADTSNSGYYQNTNGAVI